MMYATLLSLLLVCATAQSPPTLSEDFTAHAKVDGVAGTLYMDFIGTRERFDANPLGFDNLSTWQFWNATSSTGREFIHDEKLGFCRSATFSQPIIGVFSYLSRTTLHGKCLNTENLWAWVNGAEEYRACISADGTVPHWVELWTDSVQMTIQFQVYTAGRPASSQFALPSGCQ